MLSGTGSTSANVEPQHDTMKDATPSHPMAHAPPMASNGDDE